MTDIGVDRIRYLGWFALWTAGMALSFPATHNSAVRMLIPGLFLIGSFILPPEPGEVPLYDKKLTWRDALFFVLCGLAIPVLILVDELPLTRGFLTASGDWMMRNWTWCSLALWLIGSAIMARRWYRREHTLAATTTP